MKSMALVLACFCVALCTVTGFGFFYLWSKGLLSPEKIADVREMLAKDPGKSGTETAEDAERPQPSLEEVIEARARLAVEFQSRDSELNMIKGLNQTWTQRLQTERAEFDTQQKGFEDRLKALETKLNSESTEQSRGVLTAMSPKNAVEHLMTLPLDEAVVLLKGLPEKSIAKILKEFKIELQPAEPGSKAERGAKLFEALAKGNPQRAVLEQELKAAGIPSTAKSPRTLPADE